MSSISSTICLEEDRRLAVSLWLRFGVGVHPEGFTLKGTPNQHVNFPGFVLPQPRKIGLILLIGVGAFFYLGSGACIREVSDAYAFASIWTSIRIPRSDMVRLPSTSFDSAPFGTSGQAGRVAPFGTSGQAGRVAHHKPIEWQNGGSATSLIRVGAFYVGRGFPSPAKGGIRMNPNPRPIEVQGEVYPEPTCSSLHSNSLQES